jgi:ABC-type sugar transport system ATPase subunit
MPTIHLRHIIKRYDGHEPDGLDRTINAATRTGGRAYADRIQVQHETPNRANAVDDLSLIIKNGETLSILGPSGCGKTTLLKIIAGLLHPDAGEVLYDGVDLRDIPMAERGIGMVFQNYALYPHLETRENIGFYDLIHKHPEKIPERIEHIVKVMGVNIEHLLSRKPPTLSGGEQQRVAVARCLARDPKLFLFDEPLSNLDAKLRTETRLQLHRLLRHYQITSVYVTHDQTEAIALADRIAIMRDGKIEQIGTFQVLYDTPVNAFVAEFFGTPPMNLFPGHSWGEHWEGSGMTVTPIRPGLNPGQAVWLGIRPEHIEITAEGIPATVEYIEPILTQQRQFFYLNIGRQRCVVVTGLDRHAAPGDTLHLSFPTERLYFFDKNTGARIG